MKEVAWWLGILFVVAVGGFLVVYRMAQPQGHPMKPARPVENHSVGRSDHTGTPLADADKIGAWVMAEDFVRGGLKAPSTARFGSVFGGDYQRPDDCVSVLGGGRYRVVGWVDAQNSFGALIRNNFVCVLRDRGNDMWRCEELIILPR